MNVAESIIRIEARKLSMPVENLRVLDVTQTDLPTPPFSHRTTWEVLLQDGERFARTQIPGDLLLTDALRLKLMALGGALA